MMNIKLLSRLNGYHAFRTLENTAIIKRKRRVPLNAATLMRPVQLLSTTIATTTVVTKLMRPVQLLSKYVKNINLEPDFLPGSFDPTHLTPGLAKYERE